MHSGGPESAYVIIFFNKIWLFGFLNLDCVWLQNEGSKLWCVCLAHSCQFIDNSGQKNDFCGSGRAEKVHAKKSENPTWLCGTCVYGGRIGSSYGRVAERLCLQWRPFWVDKRRHTDWPDTDVAVAMPSIPPPLHPRCSQTLQQTFNMYGFRFNVALRECGTVKVARPVCVASIKNRIACLGRSFFWTSR